MYRHKQFGWFFTVILLACAAVLALVAVRSPDHDKDALIAPSCVLLILLLLFRDLNVSVNDDILVASFGVGLIKKKIRLAEVQECSIVKTPWYIGWGIRFGPGYTIYTIAGSDAVEFAFKDGRRKVRIGTDEPEALYEAVRSKLQS